VVKTFQLALRSTHRYRSETGVKIWLFRLALQICRRLLPGLAARRFEREPPSALGPEAASHTAEDDLWLAVDAPPHRLRLLLLLHDVHGLPVSEIVQVLALRGGCPGVLRLKGRSRRRMPVASDEALSGRLAVDWVRPNLTSPQPGSEAARRLNRRRA
jgi:hypothetical protein